MSPRLPPPEEPGDPMAQAEMAGVVFCPPEGLSRFADTGLPYPR